MGAACRMVNSSQVQCDKLSLASFLAPLTMTNSKGPTSPPATAEKPARRGTWECWNLRLIRDLRKQPAALAVMVGSAVLATISGSLAWYVIAFARAPLDLKRLDDHITILEKNQETRFRRIEEQIEGEAFRDDEDRIVISKVSGRLDAIEKWLQVIAEKL